MGNSAFPKPLRVAMNRRTWATLCRTWIFDGPVTSNPGCHAVSWLDPRRTCTEKKFELHPFTSGASPPKPQFHTVQIIGGQLTGECFPKELTMRQQKRRTTTWALVHLVAFAALAGMPSKFALAADTATTAPPSAEALAEAKTLREKGAALFNKKEYGQAVEFFQKSLVIERKIGVMAQMASALKELRRYDDALGWYEKALGEFTNVKPTTLKKIITERDDLLSKVGTIAVEGDVIQGARLFIDDRDVGELPLQAPVRVLGGVHDVRMEKSGFAPLTASVEVTAGKASIAKLVAKERQAKLEIREKHNWVLRIEIDGQDAGVTPVSKFVSPGEHRIRLRGHMQPDALLLCETPGEPVDMGARMESEEITVKLGLFETQSVELSAEDMDASLRIEANPTGAGLWIDGHDVGKSPWEGRLALGEHAVEVRSKGFYVAKQQVTLERRKQREMSISLERVPEPPGFWTGRTVGVTSAMGIGLLGVGLFGVTGGMALQNASDLKATCRNGICPGGSEARLEETHTLGNAALAGIIVGGVGMAAGASIWFFAKPKEKPRDTRERAGLTVQMGTGGVVVGGRF